MKFGLLLPSFRGWFDVDAAKELVTFAEKNGLNSVWLPDRVAFPASGDEDKMLVRPMSTWLKDSEDIQHWGQHGGGYRASENVGECFRDVYVMSGLIAGLTDNMNIGTSVAIVPLRNPIATARVIATLDVMTKGRFNWGVGTGHILGEFEALNLNFDERHDMIEEWLRCMIGLWSNDPASFHGKYYNFDDLRMLLPPYSDPHPPVYMGGQSKRFMRLAAKIGQGWVPAYLKPNELRRGMDYIQEHWTKEGRHGEPRTVMILRFRLTEKQEDTPPGSRPNFTPDQLSELIQEYERVGCAEIIAHIPTRSLETMKHQLHLLLNEVKPLIGSAGR